MLRIAAHHSPQDLAQGLGRASYPYNCGIHYEAVEVAEEIRRAQHRPPYDKLIDLSDETIFKTRQRPPLQPHEAGRTSAVEPVRVEADRRHGVGVLPQQ